MMKPRLTLITAVLVGVAIGASITSLFYRRVIRLAIPPTLQAMEDSQRYRCILSMAVLERLETNQPDRAKRLLVSEVASYYRHPLGLPQSPDRKTTLESIEKLRQKSSALNEEISGSPRSPSGEAPR